MHDELRRPPAFQEYASDIRSLPFYQMMTNDERAVWHGLRLALWCWNVIPACLSDPCPRLDDEQGGRAARSHRARALHVPPRGR